MAADTSVAGRIWDGKEAKPGVLHIDSGTGRIVKVAKTGRLATHHDFGKRLVAPGAIDVHVHFRDPGQVHKEDIQSGSTAAAFGGVTGFVDMPNTVPPTSTLRAVEAKLEIASRRSVVDYGVWAGGTWFTNDLPQMLEHAVGVKTYLGATTGDLLLEDPKAFQEILKMCGAAGKPIILHCEAQRVLSRYKRNEATVEDHDAGRPPLAEVEAIYDVMKALPGVKPPPRVHIAHVASREAVQAAKTAKFSMGVCPHHLVLDTARDWQHAYGKVNPPLRGPAQREAVWSSFVDGTVPILESDHAPHSQKEKEDSFHTAPAGLPGVETMVPLLMADVVKGRLPLARLIDASSTAPALLLGIPRGQLAKDHVADFAVYDLEAMAAIDGGSLHSKCGWSPYDGMDAVFPTHTFVRGQPVVSAGELVAKPGAGAPLLA